LSRAFGVGVRPLRLEEAVFEAALQGAGPASRRAGNWQL
jgi:hypothetical protein